MTEPKQPVKNSFPYLEIGERFMAAVKLIGLEKQQEMAVFFSVSDRTMSGICRGEYLPNTKMLLKLHEAKVNFCWILTGENPSGRMVSDLTGEVERQLYAATLAMINKLTDDVLKGKGHSGGRSRPEEEPPSVPLTAHETHLLALYRGGNEQIVLVLNSLIEHNNIVTTSKSGAA